MSQNVEIRWDWADTKVHPAVRYPSLWVSGTTDVQKSPLIGMVDSFNPRIVTPKEVINSLSDGNQGMVSKFPEYYIDITCKPFGEGYELLLACQNGDRYFDVILLPLSNYTDEDDVVEVGQPDAAWGPLKEVFIGCKILNSNERYSMGTTPTVTFSCRGLRFALNDTTFGNGRLGRSYTRDEIHGLEENPS